MGSWSACTFMLQKCYHGNKGKLQCDSLQCRIMQGRIAQQIISVVWPMHEHMLMSRPIIEYSRVRFMEMCNMFCGAMNLRVSSRSLSSVVSLAHLGWLSILLTIAVYSQHSPDIEELRCDCQRDLKEISFHMYKLSEIDSVTTIGCDRWLSCMVGMRHLQVMHRICFNKSRLTETRNPGFLEFRNSEHQELRTFGIWNVCNSWLSDFGNWRCRHMSGLPYFRIFVILKCRAPESLEFWLSGFPEFRKLQISENA